MVRAALLSLLLAFEGATIARALPPPPPIPVPRHATRARADLSRGAAAWPEQPEQPPRLPPEPEAADETNLEPSPAEAPEEPTAEATLFGPFSQPLELRPTFQLRGRIEAEAIMAAQSAESQATIGDLQNGFGFRRVRLGAQGSIADSASWISEIEVAGGNVRLRDVFVGLDALPGFQQVRIGHFREPYSLEGMTSSNFMTFLERSPINVLSPARNWGVCAYWWPEHERALLSIGAFRDDTPNNGQSLGDDGNWACTARLTGLPLYQPDENDFRLIHLGAAVSYRVPPGGVIRFTPRNSSNLLLVDDNPGSPFLPTLEVPASNYQLYNLQAASVIGPLSVQAEWSSSAIQESAMGTIFVNGMYVNYSYFLTGEHRGYNRTRGSFDQVRVLRPVIRNRRDPRGGFGALEQATQFSYLNAHSSKLPLDANGQPVGTYLYELSLALNWYLNSNTRLMFDYTAGMPDKIGFSPTVAHIFGVRAAIYW